MRKAPHGLTDARKGPGTTKSGAHSEPAVGAGVQDSNRMKQAIPRTDAASAWWDMLSSPWGHMLGRVSAILLLHFCLDRSVRSAAAGSIIQEANGSVGKLCVMVDELGGTLRASLSSRVDRVVVPELIEVSKAQL